MPGLVGFVVAGHDVPGARGRLTLGAGNEECSLQPPQPQNEPTAADPGQSQFRSVRGVPPAPSEEVVQVADVVVIMGVE
jgi:hypothetical protein